MLELPLLHGSELERRVPSDSGGPSNLPWWSWSSERALQLKRGGVLTYPGDVLKQPVAAFGPLVEGARLTGEVAGAGLATVVVSRADGRRERLEFFLGEGDADARFRAFELPFSRLSAQLGELPVPRFELELGAAGTGGAVWRSPELLVPFPARAESEFRAELVAELRWIIDLWLERAADRAGPRRTAFLTHIFDVVSGEPLAPLAGDHNVFFDLLFRAAAETGEPRWQAAFDRFLGDYLELCLHPETGLPRRWDTRLDRPLDDDSIEISTKLGFLIDMAERGPEERRQECLEAARRIASTVLRVGLAPDGGVAAKYRPSDGRPDPHVAHLRRLDLPAQLVRLSAFEGPEAARALIDAAREAAAAVEYTLRWPGSWEEIDPGFDDIYGHFGQRATEMLRIAPEEDLFRRLSAGGLVHYLPMWHQAVRHGGNVAADQVRCWEIACDLAGLEPDLLPEVAPVLADAARLHLVGQQYDSGAWGDVTVYGFDPRDNLQVGDLPGTPQNLLFGLALLHDERLEAAGGLHRDQLRALFAGVLESTRVAYRRPFGYLSTRREAAGANPSRGSIAVATGVVELLERLPRD